MQLNLYRHILESEYGMVVSGLFLGIAHPLRAGPLCLKVPRMEAEIGLVIEHEDSTKLCMSAAVLAQAMPSLAAFIKSLSEEAGVGQKECKKALVALNSMLAREVKAKDMEQLVSWCYMPNQ